MSEAIKLDFGDGAKKLMVGLSWDPNEQGSRVLGEITPHNADLVCAVINKERRVVDVITPQNPKRKEYEGQIYHKGDNLSGAADFEDEEVLVNLDNLDDNIFALAFAVGLHHGVKFSEVKNADIAFRNQYDLQKFLKIPFSEFEVAMTSVAKTRTTQVLTAYVFLDDDDNWCVKKQIVPMDNLSSKTFQVILRG